MVHWSRRPVDLTRLYLCTGFPSSRCPLVFGSPPDVTFKVSLSLLVPTNLVGLVGPLHHFYVSPSTHSCLLLSTDSRPSVVSETPPSPYSPTLVLTRNLGVFVFLIVRSSTSSMNRPRPCLQRSYSRDSVSLPLGCPSSVLRCTTVTSPRR